MWYKHVVPPAAPRFRNAFIATAALAVLCALGATSALGGSGLNFTVKNDLPRSGVPGYPQISILEPGESRLYCWYSGELAYFNRDRNAVSPGGTKSFYTETKQSGAPCLTDYDGPVLGLGVFVRLAPGRQWMRVRTEGDDDFRLRFEKQPDICNWSDNLDYCFVLRSSLGTFSVPGDPEGGLLPGLLCWSVRSTADNNTLRNQTGNITVTVRGDAFCNTPRGRTVFPSRDGTPVYRDLPAPEGKFPRQASATVREPLRAQAQADPPKPEPDEPGKDEGVIVSFMSSAAVACDMLGLGDEKACGEVAKNENSNLSNLSTDVKKFKMTGSFGTVNERENICSATTRIEPGAGSGSVKCTKAVTTSQSTTTTTTHGWKVGADYAKSFKYTANLLFSAVESTHTVTISGEYNGSTANSVQSGTSTTKSVEVDQAALPGMVTRLDVFTQSADVNYTYDADLKMGLAGATEPVRSPAATALGMSTSDTQHCLASVVGGTTVNGSIMERQKRMLDSGLRPDNPTLKRSHQLFLKSAPFYSAGSDTCPGMPSMFPSTSAFKGQGVGTYGSTGYGDDGKPLQSWMVCVYVMPLAPRGSSENAGSRMRVEAQAPSSPCVQQKQGEPTVRVTRPGVLVDLRKGAGAGGAVFTGGLKSEQAIGTSQGDTINLGRGVSQVVRSGDGDDTVDATTGNDTVYAGPGDDVVQVGSHDYAEGGPGADDLQAREARNVQLLGGTGNDKLRASGVAGASLSGGAGDDELSVTGRLVSTALAGGPGNDTYVVSGSTGSAPRMFEMPSEGYDVLMTDRTIRAPLYVDELRATGDAAVDITAGGGRQVVVGNDAPNVIAPGRGPDVVDAGPGSDAIMMGWDAHDTVTGGPGADLFVPLGGPARARNGQLVPGARSHAILDFTPADGDRIQLRARVFGAQVANLGRAWQVVVGAAPRATAPAATVLADSSSGLLAFDRDGSGPIIPKVIAMVPDATGVAPTWFTLA